ncbi:MAG: magnesium transporter [Mycoplasmatales bacterium]|nr:magnesium transporter [Mycoplasmatales bacterium]
MKDIFGELYTDEIADLIEEMPEELATRILKSTDKETRSDINKILKYSDDQIGSVMNVDIINLKRSWTVRQAIEHIKEERNKSIISQHFFVTDSKERLTGYVTMEDLLFSRRSQKIESLSKATTSVTTTTDKEEAAILFADHNMPALPVINSSKNVIGTITADEVISIVTEEATEDIHKMAGIESDDDTPYSKKGTFSLFKSRSMWLMLLMISATLSQIVLDSFQGFSNKMLTPMLTTAMIAILPVISGAAGNAGSQSSTTVIRALATGDISSKDYFKVFIKELKVSVVIGLLLGSANFLRLAIYYWASPSVDLNTEYLMLSMAASISLLSVIILAKIVGGMLPLVAKMLKLDPAAMAAPLLTTLIDALSTMIFFGISIGIMVNVI